MSMGTNNPKTIDEIFDRMDHWRNFPSYQLERRADLFFSLYLTEVLENCLKIPINPEIIPEFPLRLGTIKYQQWRHKPKRKRSVNHSFKMDYFALSADGKTPIFVELKTDAKANIKEQENRLNTARKVGLIKLLEGAKLLFESTPENRKYYYLFEVLEKMGQVKIPSMMKQIIARKKLQGIKSTVNQIEILSEAINEPVNVFILPDNNKHVFTTPCTLITFKDFNAIVKQQPDPISKRFAVSLEEWREKLSGSFKA